MITNSIYQKIGKPSMIYKDNLQAFMTFRVSSYSQINVIQLLPCAIPIFATQICGTHRCGHPTFMGLMGLIKEGIAVAIRGNQWVVESLMKFKAQMTVMVMKLTRGAPIDLHTDLQRDPHIIRLTLKQKTSMILKKGIIRLG